MEVPYLFCCKLPNLKHLAEMMGTWSFIKLKKLWTPSLEIIFKYKCDLFSSFFLPPSQSFNCSCFSRSAVFQSILVNYLKMSFLSNLYDSPFCEHAQAEKSMHDHFLKAFCGQHVKFSAIRWMFHYTVS